MLDAAAMHAGTLPRGLACPACLGRLDDTGGQLSCSACDSRYPIENGVPVLLTAASAGELAGARTAAENAKFRQRLSSSPRLLRTIDALRPPHPFRFLVSRRNRAAFSRAVETHRSRGIVLDIGSGVLGGRNASGLSPEVRARLVSLEVAPVSPPSVVGDAHRLPWLNDSVAGVLVQGVLEHVRDARAVVAEVHRIMEPGAVVYAEVPFIQHFHLDPLDLRRFTLDGLHELFGSFEHIDSGVAAGPASALTDLLTEFFALPFGRSAAYWGTKAVAGWLFAPISLLDLAWSRARRAHAAAGALYYLGRKGMS